MKVDIERLIKIVGREHLKNDPADLFVYGTDASVHLKPASAVVQPDKIEQVQKIVRYADSEGIPIVTRGSGSGMSGQSVPIKGGIVMDMKRMNRILEVNLADVYCRVEPGVVDAKLNSVLKPHGVFYPPASASSKIATIGGEIGNNASGIRSVKYGAVRDYVLGMKVVLANGELVSLGSKTRVEAACYQIERLMVGSEGTLGIIVEATLKFVPIPRFRCLGIAKFNKLEEAGEAIAEIMTSGAQPSMLELMDNVAIIAVNNTMNMGLPDVEAVLLFEADGMIQEAVDYEINKIKGVCEIHNGFGIELSYDEKERSRIYAGRKQLFPSLSRYKKGYVVTSLADDMAVPYSKMAETARKIHEIADRNNIIMSAYGHCGSGCMHTKILMNPLQKEQRDNARHAVSEIYDYVRSIGGTTSAEHGIGISKAPDCRKEKSTALDIMRAVKKAFDPNNILNPGKLMDAPDDWVTATKLRYRVSI